MSEQVDQKQRVLKIIVIALGIAIVVSIGIIVTTLALRAARLGSEQPVEAPTADHAAKPEGKMLGDLDVHIPYGARVIEVTGGPRELYVLLDTPDGRQLLLIDRRTGDVLGALRFVPGAAPAAPAAAP